MTIRNPARERLERGELCLGLGIRLARSVDIAKILKSSGYDWLFLDLEHGTMSLDTASQISVAALDAGIAPIVRVPMMQHTMASRALDGGALGIVMPHVDTAEEAEAVVAHLKYPPLGHRSVAGPQAFFGYRPVPVGEAARTMNAETLIVVMLETPQAIANADAIAAVPGIDVLLIGTNDLAMEMGIPGQFDHAEIGRAYERVIAACRRHNKAPGMGGVYTEDLLARYVDLGMRMILSGNDLSLIIAGANQKTKFLRSRA
jgi:2-keto-3-deoxy-L-rhamnonate aldolase RhmA